MGQDSFWTGATVDLWRQLAERKQLRYKFIALPEDDDLVDRLAAGNIDVALTGHLGGDRIDSVHYLQHHYLSTVAVARPSTNKIIDVVKSIFSQQFLYIVLSLSVLLLVIGTIIYFVERNKNDEQFGGGGSLVRGIGSGFWWAGVTMTTIGYGDKAPATFAGRVIAMLWMLIAMGLTASLTAAVVSALGAKNTVSFPGDLGELRVAVVEESPTARYLRDMGYDFTAYDSVEKALDDLKKENIDAVVADEGLLNYQVKQGGFSFDVSSTNDVPIAHALMVRGDGALADQLDDTLVEFILSPTWRDKLREYGLGRSGEK